MADKINPSYPFENILLILSMVDEEINLPASVAVHRVHLRCRER
jgi:hypothetical protein